MEQRFVGFRRLLHAVGASEDFAEFVRARGDHYLRMCVALTGSMVSAEDVFQSAVERLLRAWSRSAPDNPDAYLRRIIVNETIDVSRRRRRRRETLVAEVPDNPTSPASPDRAALEVLDALPPQQRAIVVLRVLEDLDVRRTAQLLNISEGAVKSGLSRGLANLRHDTAGAELS